MPIPDSPLCPICDHFALGILSKGTE